MVLLVQSSGTSTCTVPEDGTEPLETCCRFLQKKKKEKKNFIRSQSSSILLASNQGGGVQLSFIFVKFIGAWRRAHLGSLEDRRGEGNKRPHCDLPTIRSL